MLLQNLAAWLQPARQRQLNDPGVFHVFACFAGKQISFTGSTTCGAAFCSSKQAMAHIGMLAQKCLRWLGFTLCRKGSWRGWEAEDMNP